MRIQTSTSRKGKDFPISWGGPVVAMLLFSAPSIWAATYTDCRQYGGAAYCAEPDVTPWRVGTGNLYYSGVPPLGAKPYCASYTSDTVAARTPNDAVRQYADLFTQQFVDDCLVDVIRIVQMNDCDAVPETVIPFSWTIQNRSSSPYWSKSVIAKAQCEVRSYYASDPNSYGIIPNPWRDSCSSGVAILSPTGKVLCLKPDPKKEEKDTPNCGDAAGNPIDLSTGNKYQAANDFTDGSGRLTFRRYYNSSIDGAGILGRAWSSEYDARIFHTRDAVAYGGVEIITIRRGSGAKIQLAPDASGTVFRPYSTDLTLKVQVQKDSQGTITGYATILTDGSVEYFDSRGLLSKVVQRDGYTRTLAYDADDRLQSVTDNFGRKLSFTYVSTISQKGFYISKMTTPGGLEFQYSYNQVGPNARLTSVTQPTGKTVQYTYDDAYRLTGIVDELGVQFATFGYDGNGDAISTEHAGGAEAVNVTRTLNGDGSLSLAINNAGVQTTRQYVNIGGRMVLSQQSNPAGSGCAASTRSIAYDANLNPIQVDEFDGTRVCRAFDLSRNLKSVEVRGLTTTACSAVLSDGVSLPSSAAKTTYKWHPEFGTPVKVAAPGSITTFIYNGQPDPFNGNTPASCAPTGAVLPDGAPIRVLCRTVEQATADADGSKGFAALPDSSVPTRTMAYTYNAVGQLVTKTDARGFTTNYAYYSATTASVTQGDLQSVTPPKGLGMSFGSYNKDGYLLGATDSNGYGITYVYDQMNRPKQVIAGGKTTTYVYDDKGRITQLIGPAGELASMTYDAADRVQQISDAQGNTVTYTLDTAGNVLREEYKDPAGTLKRWLERSFDALNRMYRTKGL